MKMIEVMDILNPLFAVVFMALLVLFLLYTIWDLRKTDKLQEAMRKDLELDMKIKEEILKKQMEEEE